MDRIEAEILTGLADARAAGLNLQDPDTAAEFTRAVMGELAKERRKKNRRGVAACLAAAIEKTKVSTPQGDNTGD